MSAERSFIWTYSFDGEVTLHEEQVRSICGKGEGPLTEVDWKEAVRSRLDESIALGLEDGDIAEVVYE